MQGTKCTHILARQFVSSRMTRLRGIELSPSTAKIVASSNFKKIKEKKE